jgi:uncharacterized protein YjaG (DUF416 family)
MSQVAQELGKLLTENSIQKRKIKSLESSLKKQILLTKKLRSSIRRFGIKNISDIVK